MKKSTGILLGVLGAVVLIIIIPLLWGISSYNGIVNEQTNVDSKAANIQAELQRRNDLIPNLVNTVKGYAAHEETIFTAVANARAKLAGATTIAEQDAANTELSGALSRLLAIAENYPDLKASQNFTGLQTQLEGTENRIKVARTDYNKAVQTYNARIRRFPNSIIAGMFGFEKAESFQGTANAQSVPEVSF
jgi:LemA protein